MTQPGLSAVPTGTLLDRALLHLRTGPAESRVIARETCFTARRCMSRISASPAAEKRRG